MPSDSNTTADDRIIDFLRLKMMRLHKACEEIIARENEDIMDMDDPNCYGAGWAAGAVNAAQEIMDCINEEIGDE